MKTTLTLSALAFALTLAPAAFANGAQEQTQPTVVEIAASTAATVTNSAAQVSPLISVARSVLERIDAEARANLLSSLRDNSLQVLQVVAPVLVDATTVSKTLDLSAR